MHKKMEWGGKEPYIGIYCFHVRYRYMKWRKKPTSQRLRKEFAVRSPRSVDTPGSDEEDNNQYAIRLRERHGGNENTPLRASTEDVSTTRTSPFDREIPSGIPGDVSMNHTSSLDREIPSGTPEDVSMTHTSPLDREIPSGTPEDVSMSHTSPRNAQETAFGNVSERESPLEVESPPEPRPRRVRHPPRWMADPNWVCYQHTVPTMPATSTIIHVFFPHLGHRQSRQQDICYSCGYKGHWSSEYKTGYSYRQSGAPGAFSFRKTWTPADKNADTGHNSGKRASIRQ
ncbi:hypothetical protein QZH41_004846 [Actinostola sp. cb2023]|nr:hypothetical protein QZH41_004846 [Actinostola sp. cb2023]